MLLWLSAFKKVSLFSNGIGSRILYSKFWNTGSYLERTLSYDIDGDPWDGEGTYD